MRFFSGSNIWIFLASLVIEILIFISSLLHYQKTYALKNTKALIDQKSFLLKFEELSKKSLKNSFFSAQFTQDFYSALREKISSSKGSLNVKKPNLFKFSIIHPRNEFYVSNGSEFWKYEPEFNHAQKLNGSTKELKFIEIFTTTGSINKMYDISEWSRSNETTQSENKPLVNSDLPPPPKKGLLFAKLIPKEDKQQKILYAIMDVKTGHILELRIVWNNGNRTRFVFSEFSNAKLPDSFFNFVPPKGTVVNKIE